MPLKKSQKSLKAWTKQKWRTKSGKPSTQGKKATGERYLPLLLSKHCPRQSMLPQPVQNVRLRRQASRSQKQPKKIAKKTRKYRKV